MTQLELGRALSPQTSLITGPVSLGAVGQDLAGKVLPCSGCSVYGREIFGGKCRVRGVFVIFMKSL